MAMREENLHAGWKWETMNFIGVALPNLNKWYYYVMLLVPLCYVVPLCHVVGTTVSCCRHHCVMLCHCVMLKLPLCHVEATTVSCYTVSCCRCHCVMLKLPLCHVEATTVCHCVMLKLPLCHVEATTVSCCRCHCVMLKLPLCHVEATTVALCHVEATTVSCCRCHCVMLKLPLCHVEATTVVVHVAHQVTCPPDYRLWQQTMYSQFGQKWSRLQQGPMWNVVFSAQASEVGEGIPSDVDPEDSHCRSTMKALVNIPAISDRSLRRDIASSNIHLGSQIQETVLDDAAKAHPDAWWWLKADGCDISKGLKESVKQQWSGDVDLNDGSLQKQFAEYKVRLGIAEKVGIEKEKVTEDLDAVLEDLVKDLDFIHSELKKYNDTYSEKLQSDKYSDKDMINLSWKIKELGDLNGMGRLLRTEIDRLFRRMKAGECLWEQENIPRSMAEIQKNLTTFIKGITRHQRIPASHVLVFMISNEERRNKPYAIPVQCIPYKSLTDLKVRELANKVIQEMTSRKMKVAGFTTDGEWNSLHSQQR
ncbi:uncharacterized protein [Dysidea avara]|uniref:uncharacterized protein n=1 Tax=Dysidea avara TaxID=196820 RepID=UPI003333971C